MRCFSAADTKKTFSSHKLAGTYRVFLGLVLMDLLLYSITERES